MLAMAAVLVWLAPVGPLAGAAVSPEALAAVSGSAWPSPALSGAAGAAAAASVSVRLAGTGPLPGVEARVVELGTGSISRAETSLSVSAVVAVGR